MGGIGLRSKKLTSKQTRGALEKHSQEVEKIDYKSKGFRIIFFGFKHLFSPMFSISIKRKEVSKLTMDCNAAQLELEFFLADLALEGLGFL